ncbi:Alanine--tRNA ligase, partial [Coemansia sp. RSA 1933]
FDQIRKRFADAEKAAQAEALKHATEQVQSLIEQNPDQDAFVVRLPAAGKALAQIATFVKNLKNKAVYFIALDGDQVTHQCVVGKPLVARGLKANEWAAVVAAIVGGKCGGKEESARGSGSEVDKIDEAVAAAQNFMNTHLN